MQQRHDPTHAHHHGHAHDHHHCHVPATQPAADALISARGLGVARGGRQLLDGVDIDVHPGEIVTLIGPNGAGKTTLVRVLLGLERADRGEIHRATGLRIGYVPQRFDVDRTIPISVARFLTLAQRASIAEIDQVLAEVGAGHVADRQMTRLSGGETQRVLLARALLRQPALLVLDEPARGVDTIGEAELYTLIGRLREQRRLGVLLVSHDLHIVMAQSNRVLCLNRHVCCSGIPETVAQHPEYVALFGLEAARALGVYHHVHDHSHDLAGAPLGVEPVARTGKR